MKVTSNTCVRVPLDGGASVVLCKAQNTRPRHPGRVAAQSNSEMDQQQQLPASVGQDAPTAVPLQNYPQRAQVAQLLNSLFASMEVLCIKTRGFTFNITSKDFYEFHSFFNLTIKTLQDFSYEVAERVRSLGEWALVSVTDITRNSIIRDQNNTVTDPLVMVHILLGDYATLTELCRQIFRLAGTDGDAGTIALMTKTTLQLEHYQWELRSMTEKYGA